MRIKLGTSSIRLLNNSVLNSLGIAIPIFVGFFTIPQIIEILGTEAFGVLTIVWMILGYFSLFDFGLGRALTKIVSEKIGTKKMPEIVSDLWSNLSLVFGVSLIISALLIGFSDQFANLIFNVSDKLKNEIVSCLIWIGLGLPAVTTTSLLKGYIEAFKDFRALNVLQIMMGLFNFTSPLFVVHSNQKLSDAVLILMLARWVFLALHFYLSKKQYSVSFKFSFNSQLLIRSIKFGSWLTVSNIVGPMMVYFDRFILSSFLPSSSIAYYTTPYEVCSRLLLVPQAVSRALFPEISQGGGLNERKSVLKTSLLTVGLLMLIPTIILFLFSESILNWWLGLEFARQSSLILRVLIIGVYINSLAWIPFTEIQSAERADLTAKLHFFELLIYLPSLLWMITKWGLLGVAICWTLRVLIDAVFLFLINQYIRNGKT